MNNNQNFSTVGNSRESIEYFVKTCNSRVVLELAYQLGIVSPQDEKNLLKNMSPYLSKKIESYADNLRTVVAKALNDEAINKLCSRYKLKNGTPIENVVEYIKRDIFSQLRSTTWEIIDSVEKSHGRNIIPLPLPYGQNSNVGFSSPHLNFYKNLPERGRKAFAEAFGVDISELGTCFTKKGLDFLISKYKNLLPPPPAETGNNAGVTPQTQEISFSSFDELFRNALLVNVPNNGSSWEDISEYETSKNMELSLSSKHEGTQDFCPDYLSFFRLLHKRGRQTFAEAFGVDVDNLSACFTDEGLAFLQNKYGCSEKTTFTKFSEIFQHALGINIPPKDYQDWEWIVGYEGCRGRFTNARGLFPVCGLQEPKEEHKATEAKPDFSALLGVTMADAAVRSGMSVSRTLEVSHDELG